MPNITMPVRLARRLPDPLSNSTHGTERHVFFVPASALPTNIPTTPAPRMGRRWDVYRQVRASLLDQDGTPGTFHLKNRGITIVARGVEKMEEGEYQISLADGQGVIDGAQTYAVVREAIQDRGVVLPAQQFIRVEVITRLPDAWVGEVAGALSASIQSPADSMMLLGDALGWLREELQSRHYYGSIAWNEEEKGDIDVKDILCVLTCFDTSAYANKGASHPVVAYENRSVVLSSFEQDYKSTGGEAYRRLRPIVRDILTLHDVIQSEFPTFYRQAGQTASSLVEVSPQKPFVFPYLGASGPQRLARGPLYSVLAAFRWLVENDDSRDGVASWRGGFSGVLHRWRELAPKFVQLTVDRLTETGGSADTLGRSASHWGMLHREVALAELTTSSPGVSAAAGR